MPFTVTVVMCSLGSTFAKEAVPPVQDFTVPAKTRAPYTYCIWYMKDPDKPSFLKELKASPPDLFHLGYHIPFKGALGPTYGHDLFTNDILPPHEVPREVERVRNVIAGLRAAGVARLIPYVYSMAFFGHPDERTGFFRFFDHWEDYRAFGLGPKPQADPSLWTQARTPDPLLQASPGVLHYNPCVNHPGWRDYLDLVVRQLALVGYDGMFFDVNTQYCYCPHCEEQFDIYLLEKYGRAGLRDAFGTDDHRLLNLPTIYRDFEAAVLEAFRQHLANIWHRDNLDAILGTETPASLDEDWRLLRCYMQQSAGEFPPRDRFRKHLRERFGGVRAADVAEEKRPEFVQTVLRRYFHEFLESRALAKLLEQRFDSADIRARCCGTPSDMLLWVETQRFWCRSMASLHARLKRVGRQVLAEQGRADDFYTVANLGSMATLDGLNKRRVSGIDLVHWAPMADLQMFEEMHQPGSLESGVILSNVFAFRWSMGAGTRAGTLLYEIYDDTAADLAEAEAAAGGGGAFIQRAIDAPASRARWKQFFTQHADLWDNGVSWARVGLLFWSDQVFYEFPEHFAMAQTLARVLAECQIPFDIIVEENLAAVSQYDVVFAPMLRYLDDAQVTMLLDYAKAGGNLIVVEPFGTEDKWARPRPASPLSHTGPCRGKLLRFKPDDVPPRRSDLWLLMEERGSDFIRAQNFLNEARRADLKNGVDLGPRFVRKIEETLGTRLRWCPDETDAGVYIHAYRIPGKDSRPERVIVHVVNYRVPILVDKVTDDHGKPLWPVETKSGDPVPAQGLRITAPLPTDRRVRNAEALSPVDEVHPVTCSTEGNNVRVTIDRLRIYQAIVLDLDS